MAPLVHDGDAQHARRLRESLDIACPAPVALAIWAAVPPCLGSSRRVSKSLTALQQMQATSYNVTGSDKDFSFVTIRLAGHMVPQYQPASAFTFIEGFLMGKPF